LKIRYFRTTPRHSNRGIRPKILRPKRRKPRIFWNRTSVAERRGIKPLRKRLKFCRSFRAKMSIFQLTRCSVLRHFTNDYFLIATPLLKAVSSTNFQNCLTSVNKMWVRPCCLFFQRFNSFQTFFILPF
jgi:hypothetical protein